MDLANLIHMANRIGQFFEAMPDRADALAGVADHIVKFWTPAMRRQLGRAIRDGQAHELRPLVTDAWHAHGHLGGEGEPPTQSPDGRPAPTGG